MRKETDFSKVEEVFKDRMVCTRPGMDNHWKAKIDFEDGLSDYFTFPIKGTETRGYVRVLKLAYNVVDYLSPWNSDEARAILKRLAKQYETLYIPDGNLPRALNIRDIEPSSEVIDLNVLTEGVQQRVYTTGESRKLLRII